MCAIICSEMGKHTHQTIDDGLSVTDRELFERLGWFIHARWMLGLLGLAMLLVSWIVLGMRFQPADAEPTPIPAVATIAAVFLYNAGFNIAYHAIRVRGLVSHRLTVSVALGQILCDIAAICILAHFTGGLENWFIILLLVPVVVATEFLPHATALLAAGAAAAGVHLLGWGELQGVIPHVSLVTASTGSLRKAGLYADPYYVLEVTTAMTVTLFAMTIIASTITRRLRVRERELEQAYRRCHLADEAKSFFMRKAGHEMRGPLAATHNILNAIASTGECLSEEQKRLITRATVRLNGFAAMVDDLRRYSRLQSPDDMVHSGKTDLSDVATEVAENLRPQAAEANLTVNCDLSPAYIVADRELIRDVVRNLISNAIQYTPAGGEIDVSVRTQHRQAVLTVADTGMGLSEAAREHIFEDFYRAPEARKAFPEGTGLGLAICRRIAEMHGGSIQARPRETVGTVFEFRLPAVNPNSA
ncbi:MAG: sensor histidine kinase [Phycisphaerae bacterium]